MATLNDLTVSVGIAFRGPNGEGGDEIYAVQRDTLQLSPYVRIRLDQEVLDLSAQQAQAVGASLIQAGVTCISDSALVMFMMDVMGMELSDAEKVMSALYDRRRLYEQAFREAELETGKEMEEKNGSEG